VVFLIASINEQVVIKNDKDLNSTLDCLKVCAHHSKTLKDGWAKYIPNFALK
jgi:hypothetical protein